MIFRESTLLKSSRWPEHAVQNIIVIFLESTLLKKLRRTEHTVQNIIAIFPKLLCKKPMGTWTYSTEYYCIIPGVYFVKEPKVTWTCSTEYYCNIPGVTLLESLRWPEHTVQNIIVIFRESTLLKSQWDLNIESRRCCIVTRVCDVKEPKENWTHCTEYYCNIPRVCFVK